MRILFIGPASVNHTVKWVNAMVGRGHEVYLLSLNQHYEGINTIDNKVKVYYLNISGIKGYYLNFIDAKRFIKKIKPDIINTHYASGYGTLSRLVNSKPVLLSVWGSDIYEFPNENILKKIILKKNLKCSFRIASTSFAMAEETRKYVNKKIYVTPFGVNLDLFKPSDKNKNEIKIGIVKALKLKYGIRYLIEAVYILRERLRKEGEFKIINKIRCDIYGEGEERFQLMELTKSLNLDNIIKFRGYIENTKVPDILNSFDIFCVPSISESFGVAAVEAMACEVPVIVSNADGFREVVEDKVTGYIVPRKNSEALAERLYELIFSKWKRSELGKNGRKKVMELYDWNKNVAYMEKIYEEIVEDWKNEK